MEGRAACGRGRRPGSRNARSSTSVKATVLASSITRMGKRSQKGGSAAGEGLLAEWTVAHGVEELRAAWGGDPAADIAIVERLAQLGSASAAAALVELESTSGDKSLRKQIRRVLYRLEQRG